MNDDQLHELLLQTQTKPEFPSSFQREVWARIAVAESASWKNQWQLWSQHFFGWIAQPAPAVAMVATMLILGAGLGRLMAPDRSSDSMQRAYVTSINPVAAARLPLPR